MQAFVLILRGSIGAYDEIAPVSGGEALQKLKHRQSKRCRERPYRVIIRPLRDRARKASVNWRRAQPALRGGTALPDANGRSGHRGRGRKRKGTGALDGSGCPSEAPYGCFLPDLTRFGTCRHPNPSNALGARYILPAPARQSKVANLGRGFFDYFCSPIARAANE